MRVISNHKISEFIVPYLLQEMGMVNIVTSENVRLNQFRNLLPLTSNWSTHHTTYWQHGDHLGSASWVTDTNGLDYQHLQYMPWGEPWVDQRKTGYSYNTRYTFSGKERDEETGFSYFGARYYQPSLSIWLSVDPMADKYPGLSPYAYCGDNPVKYIDPNGEEKLIWLDRKNKDNEKIISGAEKYKDDGAIHIFAHGSSKGMTININGKNQKVRTAQQLDELLSQYSEVWENREKDGQTTIILHSCRTGEGDDSFAQKVSKELGVTVIAPDQRVYFNEDGQIGAYKAKYADSNNEYKHDDNGHIKSKERSNIKGNWRVFQNGKEINSFKGDWSPKENPTFLDRLLY